MLILLAESDRPLRAEIFGALRQSCNAVAIVGTLAEAGRSLAEAGYDLLVAGRLADGSGLELVRRCRQHQPSPGGIIVLGGPDKAGHVAALDAGADAVVGLPLDCPELVATVRALARRQPSRDGRPSRFADLLLEAGGGVARARGVDLDLTLIELALLDALMAEPDRPTPSSELIARVWSGESGARNGTLRIHALNLRRKLAAARSRVTVVGRRGLGYRLLVLDQPPRPSESRPRAVHA